MFQVKQSTCPHKYCNMMLNIVYISGQDSVAPSHHMFSMTEPEAIYVLISAAELGNIRPDIRDSCDRLKYHMNVPYWTDCVLMPTRPAACIAFVLVLLKFTASSVH